ncbi:hypothetical protein [Cohnella laeviribosi]|uniref:hypothetical protein n=1 Tax=Cohnella laeviribosi TaxID=380174 RepID=UPI0004781BA8
MTLEKTYQSLHENKIFFGGAADVEAMVKQENVDFIVDLRGEATECIPVCKCGVDPNFIRR